MSLREIIAVCVGLSLTVGVHHGHAQQAIPLAPARAEWILVREGRRMVQSYLGSGIPLGIVIPGHAPTTDFVFSFQLALKYRENEVAADRQVRNRDVVLQGQVQRVLVNPDSRQITVSLDSVTGGMPILALMRSDQEDAAASYREGTSVKLRCRGLGKVGSAIVLDECYDVNRPVAQLSERVSRDLVQWYRTGADPLSFYSAPGNSDGWKMSIFTNLWFMSQLPANSACFAATLVEARCEQDLTRVSQRLRGTYEDRVRYRAAYDADRERLGMPELGPLPAPPPSPASRRR